MKKVYLVNSFSPSMIPIPSRVEFFELSAEEFCKKVSNPNIVNAIGHQGTVDLVNSLCSANLTMNRAQIKAEVGDELLITSLMVRLPEGKVLNSEEMKQLLSEGKIKFVEARVLPLS